MEVWTEYGHEQIFKITILINFSVEKRHLIPAVSIPAISCRQIQRSQSQTPI